MVVGRRGGKSRILALIVTYLATFRDYTSYLTPGEVADRNSGDTKVVRMTPAGACEVSDGPNDRDLTYQPSAHNGGCPQHEVL